jgi:putative membrane protein
MADILHLHTWDDLWHPWVLLFSAAVTVGYLYAIGPLRRSRNLGEPVSGWQAASFLGALWLIYLAEGTPVHLLAENYLFSAHMLQHVILTVFMPPLLLMGTPPWMLRPLLRVRRLAAVMRQLTRPLPALVLFNLIYSIWHMPVLYSSAVSSHAIHMVQHALLVPTAVLMWWPLLSPLPELPRLYEGAQLLYIFGVSVSQIAVFGIITFAEEAIYPPYVAAPRVWGIDPLVDQQVAGIIMKVLGGFIMTLALTIIFFRWAAKAEQEEPRG